MALLLLDQSTHRLPSPSDSAGVLSSQIISTESGLAGLREEWDELYCRSSSQNPFLQWLWVWHWWRSFGTGTAARRHRLQLIILRDSTGAVRSIAPFVRTTWGIPPAGFRVLRLCGFDEGTTDLRTDLICPGWETQAAAMLTETLLQLRPTYDWCEWDGIPADGTAFNRLKRVPHEVRISWTLRLPEYSVPLPATWEELRSRLKRNVKENIRHCYNSLGREGHVWRFERVSDPAEIPHALSELCHLHAARSAMPNAPIHPDYYYARRNRQFLENAAVALAEQNRLWLCRLRVGEEVIASRLVFNLADSLYLSSSGFDPSWRRYGVMTLITTECLKLAIQEGRRAVSLSTGTDAGKTRWSPTERIYHTAVIHASSPRSQWFTSIHDAYIQAKKKA